MMRVDGWKCRNCGRVKKYDETGECPCGFNTYELNFVRDKKKK